MRHQGVLAIWHDVVPEREAEILHWYDREHHPERLGVPGFLTARRYLATDGAPKIFIVYEVEDAEVLASAPYLARVNAPTPWTQSMMPHFRNNSRTVCRVADGVGYGAGAYAATLRIAFQTGREDFLRERIGQLLQDFIALPGAVSAEHWIADAARSTINSDERRLRGVPDQLAQWVVVLTASIPEPLPAALDDLILPDATCEIGLYRMQFAARAQSISHNSV